MPRIQPVNPLEAAGKAKQLLEGVQAQMGMTPNLMRTMAHSPAMLKAYLAFAGNLSDGLLDPRFREQIAVAVAQANSCQYCLSAHVALGKMAGLTAEEIENSRASRSVDPKRNAGLQFAQKLVVQRGHASNLDMESVRQAGYSDGEIVELIAHVALNTLTNYFNHVAETEVDFPVVPVTLAPAA